MTATQSTTALSDRLDSVIEKETEAFLVRQPRSRAFTERARHLAGGATSNWQIAEPQAVWISHGLGSKIYDVDGFEYSDFHGGYGVSLAGHAHPAIVEAVRRRVDRGTHLAQPTEDALAVAEELVRRFGQPLWRFANSGTEATMDAVHLMRAITGRPLIVKLEGAYHGHHDSVPELAKRHSGWPKRRTSSSATASASSVGWAKWVPLATRAATAATTAGWAWPTAITP